MSRDELARLPVPAPRGPRHQPVSFYDDVCYLTEAVRAAGFVIKDEAYGVTCDKKTGEPRRFFGLVELAREGEVLARDDFALTLGLRGSHDQSVARGIAVGSRVFVCDNLAFSGTVVIKTRQTTNVESRLPHLFNAAVSRVPQFQALQEQRFETYRRTTIKPRVGDAVLVELVRRGALLPSQIGRAIREWDEPTHPEHAEGGWTLWRLHNAVTEAIKPPADSGRAYLPVALERTLHLTALLDDVAAAQTGAPVPQLAREPQVIEA